MVLPEGIASGRRGVPGPTLAAVAAALAALLPRLVVVLAVVVALRRLDDTDTWWHLAAGRSIVEHAAIPRTDTLSSTVPDHAWVDLQWLFELALYGLYRAGGPTLLVLLAAAAFGLAIALLIENLRPALGALGAALMALWVLAVAQERFTIRPEMVSFVLLQVVWWLCATADGPRSRRLWLLPLVMLAWVNTHSLFIIGAFVIACHMAGSVTARLPFLPQGWRARLEPPALRRVLLSGAAALLVTLVNPYGAQGMLFPLRLMSRISGANAAFRTIGEFIPPFSGYFVTFAISAYQLLFVFGIAVVALATVRTALPDRLPAAAPGARQSRAQRRRARTPADPASRPRGTPIPVAPAAHLDLGGLAVFAGLASLSVLARRNMAIFALGAAPFIGECLALLWRHAPGFARTIVDRATTVLAVLMPPALVAAGWFVASNGFYRWNSEMHEFGTGVLQEVLFPVRASAFAKEMALPPPLFNDLTSGGYLAWDRPLPGGVYIDGRLEVYDTDFFVRYTGLLAKPDRWQAEADRTGIQTVLFFHWWTLHRPLVRWLLRDPRWALVYFDPVAVGFLRRAGNEALVAKCQASFRPLREQTTQELLAPVASWQWPVARAHALSAYAALLETMGQADEAATFYARLLDLGPPRPETLSLALRLARYHAARGETGLARTYLQRAARIDPTNPRVAELAARLGT